MALHSNDKYPPKLKWKLVASIMGWIIIIGLIYFSNTKKVQGDILEPVATTTVATTTITPKPKIEPVRALNIDEEQMLDCIQYLENNQHIIKWWDVHSYTYGDYALKLPTVKDYRPNITDEEAIAIATDPIQAREIAREIMFVKKETWRYGYKTNPKSTIGKINNGACNK